MAAMAVSMKQPSFNGGLHALSELRQRRNIVFFAVVYVFVFLCVFFTFLVTFSPSSPASSYPLWLPKVVFQKVNGKEAFQGTVVTLDNEIPWQVSDESMKESLMGCDLFDGNWVWDDDYYPLYSPESCSLIDEQFNCLLNGRPDFEYFKLKWKPSHCHLPMLDGKEMLELLKEKRLVFVGDSLNRNMWESLVCILKQSVEDESTVYEENGRQSFREDPHYSIIFQDYNCTVEFFVAPYLVQEWHFTSKNGTKKETLRLDLMSSSSAEYKDADILVFNSGHWWTHEKTSAGKDYYQEGSHVYKELNVIEAYRKALTTWGNWIDSNINPNKSLVFFRGYSASHFRRGEWNSGGQCDDETEPITDDKYLNMNLYRDKMIVVEQVLSGMRTQVSYLNITRMSEYRKDGHPSVYRKQHYTTEEKESALRIQDCSHWCLPGVPDAWNEILFAKLLMMMS